ncbi:sulfatase [Virgibacillus phasianinus]|uniref:Sulfatase n=1 Tax=Virgibacillus phasianinus TaxID=2017483 RepID=A0A220U2F7_9BACI|nr:sulfatase [Virgibacillus phasianinus]ASK62225.1 sulfatase [Virgibacillus phasianinus]
MANKTKPNILFIMSDDHAAHAMSCYDSKINQTPNLDRIADEGMRFDNCFCTNSICAPSRAAILTGQYNHVNGVKTLGDGIDGRKPNVQKVLKDNDYQTAIVGKWHLGHGGEHDPTGFDYWNVLPDQGDYHDPKMIEMGKEKQYKGYVTDLITDISLDWLQNRSADQPFMLMCHHKAPHRPWEPDDKHAQLYEDIEIPEPETFHDDYANRSNAAKEATMRVDRDLFKTDLKMDPPENLSPAELKSWKYQRYIKDYLRVVASIDDNVGRLLDYLEEEGLAENTIVMYTSDQGFFLGDHGWYDKRFMYEESLRMPYIVRYPRAVEPGSVTDNMALNVDFAETFLDYAGIDIPDDMQGTSLRPVLEGRTPDDWQTSVYYRYWEHLSDPHKVGAHYGVRTERYKLIYYYGQALGASNTLDETRTPEWELFDLQEDPYELNNVYDDPNYADTVTILKEELHRLKEKVGDEACD